MNISKEEMRAIKSGKPARRMMRLPVAYNEEMTILRSPMAKGHPYTLRCDGEKAYITVTDVRRERLCDVSTADAKREGQPSRGLAIAAFETRHGIRGGGREVWVISFWLDEDEDDRLQLLDTPVFMSKVGDYTTTAGRQAVPGDPEVVELAGEGERARIVALAKREAPTREQVERIIADGLTLSESMTAMKARTRAALIVREAEKLRREMGVSSGPVNRLADTLPSARAAS